MRSDEGLECAFVVESNEDPGSTMNNNQAKRDLALQFVRYRTGLFGGMHVNRSHCPKLEISDELKHLLKKGMVVRARELNSSMTSYTVLRPADGITQAAVPVCKLCKGTIPYLIGQRGHKANCAGAIESLTPSGPSWGQIIANRKASRQRIQKMIELRKKYGKAA